MCNHRQLHIRVDIECRGIADFGKPLERHGLYYEIHKAFSAAETHVDSDFPRSTKALSIVCPSLLCMVIAQQGEGYFFTCLVASVVPRGTPRRLKGRDGNAPFIARVPSPNRPAIPF